MPVLSYVHQLFNAEQCHAYIHTLRWKDRSLQCPRCQSHNVGPWGAYHYQPELQRYRCKAHVQGVWLNYPIFAWGESFLWKEAQ